MIDGWRGLAALAVVLYHTNTISFGPSAVIVFFVISGYCITAAAESGMAKGFPFRRFMWRRFRRIYPPYAFSLLFFAATRLLKVMKGGANELARGPLVWIQNLTMTQWLSLIRHPQPPNDNSTLFVGVYWSLNYEEQFYLVMAIFIATAAMHGRQLKHLVLGLLGVALVWNAFFPSVAFGFFIDYWSHFALGALVFYRLCRPMPALFKRLIDGGLVALCLACVLMTKFGHSVGHRSVYRELSVASGFAIVLLLARPLDALYRRSGVSAWLGKLGLISYSLYLTHKFNLVFTAELSARLFRSGPESVVVAAQVVMLLAIAIGFWFLCERPFLNRSGAAQATGARQSAQGST